MKMEYRKSQQDIKHMFVKRLYPGTIPCELRPYHYYVLDSGHCIMCVLECHLKDAEKTSMDDYEIPVPVKYVLEKGYKITDGYVVTEAPYDSMLGLTIDEKYSEY